MLVTPNETDARVGFAFLADAGIAVRALRALDELAATPLETVGCAVLVEEALTRTEVETFREVLARQPAWSDLPLVLLASQGTSLGALVERVFPDSGNLAVLERPLNPVTLITAVRMGLRARNRQLQVRDLLEQRSIAVRRRDEFLAMLAHELRNPLAPLRNAVYIMRQPALAGSVLGKTVDLIDRQTTHLKRLVDDLLDVSRLEVGKVQLRREAVDLNVAVSAAVEACMPAIAARGQVMDARLAPEPLTIDADPVRIEQVIGNLVSNASKFTPERGGIRVQVSRDGGDATVAVCDDGVGIRSDMLDNVFDLFAQDDKTLERSGGGLGIGLTIVKRLVELHGGTISVASEGAGKGACFTVRFPLTHVRPHAQRPRTGDAAAPAHRRVLVVEDNPDIRQSLGMMLDIWGHEVQFAENGHDGVQRALQMHPDVALIDIGLPGLNGYDVARRIRASGEGWAQAVTLVALTGYGRDSDRDQALRAGFDTHLVKPVDPHVLAGSLAANVRNATEEGHMPQTDAAARGE